MNNEQPKTEPPFGDIRSAALACYTAPFRYDHGYIFDAENRMISDDTGSEDAQLTHVIARVRGWGYLQYKERGAALQDEIGKIIAESLTKFWQENLGPFKR